MVPCQHDQLTSLLRPVAQDVEDLLGALDHQPVRLRVPDEGVSRFPGLLVKVREMVEGNLFPARELDPLAAVVLDGVDAEGAILIPKDLGEENQSHRFEFRSEKAYFLLTQTAHRWHHRASLESALVS